MSEQDRHLPPWNPNDLPALLRLHALGPGRFQNRHGDANSSRRGYGGQVLGQALMAAAQTVDAARGAASMQFMFLRGVIPEQPVEFVVSSLQEGKRFSSRKVQGTQREGGAGGGAGGGQVERIVFDAQISFALPLRSPEHEEPSAATETRPDELPPVPAPGSALDASLSRLNGYTLRGKACLDLRIPDIEQQLSLHNPSRRFRFWSKVRTPVPDEPGMQAAAFAYLSDWWMNLSSVIVHRARLVDGQRLFIASLNHALWWHRPFRADEWLHFDTDSPGSLSGFGSGPRWACKRAQPRRKAQPYPLVWRAFATTDQPACRPNPPGRGDLRRRASLPTRCVAWPHASSAPSLAPQLTPARARPKARQAPRRVGGGGGGGTAHHDFCGGDGRGRAFAGGCCRRL